MSAISYRLAATGDIPSLAKIRAVNWGTEDYWKNRIAGYMEGTINPQGAFRERVIYVATDRDTVIGFIGGHLTCRFECAGELEWIDVTVHYRRKGVALALVKLLAHWFEEYKAYKVCIDPGSEEARKFYSRLGADLLDEHWMFWKDIRTVLT